MSKSVIASLKPYYYYLVGEGIKTAEVRKSEPKADDWNRETYFYMSKDEKSFAKIPKEYQDKYRKYFGKVGLKFVCDRIIQCNYHSIITLDGINTTYFIFNDDLKATCLTYDEIENYGKGDDLYSWHISDLKIYDKPKELSEFRKPCSQKQCASWCKDMKVEHAICLNKDKRFMEKAPQSWGYCEELEK